MPFIERRRKGPSSLCLLLVESWDGRSNCSNGDLGTTLSSPNSLLLLFNRLAAVLVTASLLIFTTACSSVQYAPDKAPRMVVQTDGTLFYLHGPAQGNGADRTLVKGDEVKPVLQPPC